MNKKLFIPMAVVGIATMLSGVSSVAAKQFTKSKVISEYSASEGYYDNVYIIGNYLFKDGLSAKEMFIAGESVEDKEDAIIYHFHTDGTTWSDAFTDETLADVPENFDLRVVYTYDAEGNRVITKFVSDEMAKKLKETTDEAKKLNEADYTVDSWKKLTDAQALTEEDNAEVQTKIDAINAAIDDLEFANQAALNAALDKAAKRVEAEYTVDSWEALTEAKAMTEETNAEVGEKAEAITTAIDGLVFANLADLTAAKEAATSKIESGDYAESTVTALNDALALPETTYAEIDAKIDAINAVTLEFANQAALNDALAKAAKRVEAEYTPVSWKALTDAKAMTEETNAEVGEKAEAITAAIDGLVFANLADLEELEAEYEETVKNKGMYETESYNEFVNTYAVAAAKENDSYQAIAEKIDEMTRAFNALKVNNISKTAFNDAVAAHFEADGATLVKTQADYTPETWAAYKTALDAAVAVKADANATGNEMAKALNDLNVATAGLVKANQAALEEAKAEAAKLNADDYATVTWNVLATAQTMPETTNAEMGAKATAINDAIAALVTREAEKALSDAIVAASAITSDFAKYYTEYSEDSTDALDTAISNVVFDVELRDNEYFLNTILTGENVNNLTKAINDAVAGLEFAAMPELETELAKVDALNEIDYEAEAWRIFQSTLASIKTEDFENNDQVVSNLNAIKDAIVTLEKSSILVSEEKANELKAELIKDYTSEAEFNIDGAKKYTNTDWRYTDASFNAYTAAFNAAKDLYTVVSDSTHADYTKKKISDVDEAISALSTARDGLEIDTFWTGLDSALAAAKEKQNVENYDKIYTQASRDELAAAIKEAEEIIANKKRTYDEVNASISRLQKVELVADKSGLTALLDEIYGVDAEGNRNTELVNNGYTAASFSNLSFMIDFVALDVEEDEDATVEDITDAVNEVMAAKEALVKQEVEDQLLASLAEANKDTDRDHFVTATFDALTTVVNKVNGYLITDMNGNTILLTGKTVDSKFVYYKQSDFEALQTELDAAIDGLVFGNKSQLEGAVNGAQAMIDSNHYSQATVDALEAAKAMPESDYDEIQAKIAAFDAVDLVFVNEATLAEAEEKATLYDEQYDLTAINAALALPESTYEEIEAKIAALNTAIENVKPKNLAQLEDYKTLNADNDYTAESYAAFVTKCEEIIANGDTSTYTLVAKMLEQIEAAKSVLVTVKANLTTLVADQNVVEADYTAESYATYTTALTAAQEVLNDADATNAEVVAATEALETAIDGLVPVETEVAPEA